MKRTVSLLALSLVAALASTPSSLAQQRRPFDRPHPEGRGFALRRLHHCLSLLDLTPEQKAAIEGTVSGAKATLQADRESVIAARQKVESDIAAGADKCVIGGDVLARHAGAKKLHADVAAIREQVLSKLNPDQQSRLQGCFQERQRPR